MWRARMPPAPLKFPESRPSSPSQQTPLPPCPKQEQQLADAKERYTASKFFCNKAAKQLDDAMQQGASTEALEPQLLARKEQLRAAKAAVRFARASVERARAFQFAKIQSERSLLKSRELTRSFSMELDRSTTQLGTHREVLAAQAREAAAERKRAREAERRVAAAIACQTNDDLMGNEMESGWVRQWPSGRLFGDPPKTPKPKWLPPVPPPPGELPQLTELKQKLAANFGRVLDLFKKWDVDHDHTISIDELRLALGALQVHADEKALRVLFTELDADASGAIDYEELYQALRTHGAKREVPDNRITLEMPSRKEPNPDGTLAERRAVAFLKKALHNNLDRVRDIFAEWDFDGNGMISKRELQRGLAALSIAIDPRSIDILFEKLDADGSGGIEFKELNRYLRREFVFESEIVEARRITPMGGVPVAPSPEAAALGLIGSVSAPVLAPTRPQLGAQSSAAARRAATSGKRQPRMSARTQFEMRMARGDHALVRDLMKDRDDAIREQAAEARRAEEAAGKSAHAERARALQRVRSSQAAAV